MQAGQFNTPDLRAKAIAEVNKLSDGSPDEQIAAWFISEYIRVMENGLTALQSTVEALEDCVADLRG